MTRCALPRIRPLSPPQMQRCLGEIRDGFPEVELISQRENRIIVRHAGPGVDAPVIVKMWSRNDLAGRLRRMLHMGAAQREWRNLGLFQRAGLAVPRPLGFCCVSPGIAGYSEALFMEDLGDCEMATPYVQRMLRDGRAAEVEAVEDGMVEMTRRILAMGVVDADHGMVNTLVRSSGQLVRVDLELARYVLCPGAMPRKLGRMLGRIVGLYAFAVQPDHARITAFARKLMERVRPPARALAHAAEYAHRMMRVQLRETGIDTPLILPWRT